MIAEDLDTLDPEQLRQALRASRAEVAFKQAVIDKLTHENAILKRLKFAARSEAYNAEQKSLLEETLDSDLAAVAAEIEAMDPSTQAAGEKQAPKREKLPANLPRREIQHEPEKTTCGCGTPMQRIGEDVAEKLDYQPGVFTVERHIRGKWVSVRPWHLEMTQPSGEHRVHDERDELGWVEGDGICRALVECHRAGRLHHCSRDARLCASPCDGPLDLGRLSPRAASGGAATP